jgi:hypothetical protein
MVTCPSCGVLVFVDMDGIAQISIEDAEVLAEPLPEDPAPVSEASIHGFTFHSSPDLAPEPTPSEMVEESVLPSAEYTVEPHIDDHTSELSSGVEPSVEPSVEPVLIGDHGNESSGELDMDALLGIVDPQSEQAEQAEPEYGAPGDPLGINEYANSELSQAKDGFLAFKILISGIDSKEMRESLRSALDDQRFGWNPNDLLSRISKGVLQIDNVASVKAVILINRIKRMPVKVRWEQYAITKMEPS